MDDYIKKLYENVITSTKNSKEAIDILKNIKGKILSVGTGGSKVVSDYLSQVLGYKNECIVKNVDISDITEMDKKLYDGIFVSSYSGTNFGVQYCLNNDLKHYILTTNKSIKNAEIISYEMPHEHSFISLNSTIVPMSILLKYYLGDSFEKIIDEIFEKLNKSAYIDLIDEDIVNIFYSDKVISASTFIESTLVEGNIAVPIMHKLYSYCHGRHTVNKNHDMKAILIGYNNTDLENALIKNMKYQMTEYIVLKSEFKDIVVNDFYLTLQCLYLLRNIASAKCIDLSEIEYDKVSAKNLYFFKGSV